MCYRAFQLIGSRIASPRRTSRIHTLATSFLLALALTQTPASAQSSDNATANTAFAEAVRLFSDMEALDEGARYEAAREVLRLLDMIASAYPDTIPGQRVHAGGMVGPIDLGALRAMVGTAAEDTPLAAATSGETGSTIAPDPGEFKEWYEIVVPGGSVDGGYGHGAYPSRGPRTHAGVDISGSCGTDVLSAADGEVVQIVKAGDPAFPLIGNGVIVKHDTAGTAPVFSAYFRLGKSPVAALGAIEAGQPLGETGAIGGPQDCGIHFEVRSFEPKEIPVHPLWRDLFAVGDWREDTSFIQDWRDPETWLDQISFLDRIENGQLFMQPLAETATAKVYRRSLLTKWYAERTKRIVLPQSGGLIAPAVVKAEKTQEGLRISFQINTLERNPNALNNHVDQSEAFSLSVRLFAGLICDDCEPAFAEEKSTGASLDVDSADGLPAIVPFLVPNNIALGIERLQFELITSNGRTFRYPSWFDIGRLESLLAENPMSEKEAESFLRRFAQCAGWTPEPGQSIRLAAAFGQGGLFLPGQSNVISSNGLDPERTKSVFQLVTSNVETCGKDGFGLPSRKYDDWKTLEIVLGAQE